MFVEPGGGAHVEPGDEPGHEELGEGEEVGDIDRSDDGRAMKSGA